MLLSHTEFVGIRQMEVCCFDLVMGNNIVNMWSIQEKQIVLTELTACITLIRQGPHRKRRIQQFYCCCVYIRCRGEFSTESLPNRCRKIHVQEEHRLMGEIYEIRCCD
jgi:hypothetical protein